MRALLALAALLLPASASAQVYWTQDDLLADVFPTSEVVAPVTLAIDGDTRASLKGRVGPIKRDAYTFHVGWTHGVVDGYCLIDEERGQHEPITFAVVIGPDGAVVRQEVMVYREKYGSEVRADRFRDQFVGKRATDPLRPGQDIQIVTGATYSSRAMTAGVKRAVALAEILIAQAPEPPATE